MGESIKYIRDKTIDEEINISCIKCAGKTVHKVVCSYDLRGDHDDGDYSLQWATDHQIIQCQGCKTVSFRKASSNSEDWMQTSHDGGGEYLVDESIYPSRLEGIKGLGEDLHYLPTKVRRIYDETLQALSSQSPVLTGIGLRALLETVCKEKNATGKDLLKKIDSLVTACVLTPASAAILHKIRTLGNSAAHEVKPHNERQLGLAMNIVEHLLKDVYILPKQAESEFDNGV
ncbi:DUF4145 domain-containing protein [Xanthomonas cannabis]|uniref:DUF4145 domain-containing protein n=1 Tax=Xanthomonas cannabis TaxID=1885674 RepID=UPI00141B1DF3|nr:DUF4145 domain-containing protein [Xanthomonas cannabis]NIK63216.1 ribosomal protein L30/L7E [Xanthomonas cannabis]